MGLEMMDFSEEEQEVMDEESGRFHYPSAMINWLADDPDRAALVPWFKMDSRTIDIVVNEVPEVRRYVLASYAEKGRRRMAVRQQEKRRRGD